MSSYDYHQLSLNLFSTLASRNTSPPSPLELSEESVGHMLSLIFPLLEQQLMLAKNVQLIEALEELKSHEEDLAFLSPQCQFILGLCLRTCVYSPAYLHVPVPAYIPACTYLYVCVWVRVCVRAS